VAAFVVLVPSPLLGPVSWRRVVDGLRAAGCRTAVADLRPAIAAGPPFYPGLAAAIAVAAGDHDEVTLVGHSRAGPLLPAAAEALGPRVGAAVLVDARLPHPGLSWFDALPAGDARRLRDTATDGRLPPWNTWFPAAELDRLLPDPALRAAVVAEIGRLPVALLDEPAPANGARWDSLAKRYVCLSPAYADAANAAAGLGWPVDRHDADHLAILTRPELVTGLFPVRPGYA